MALGQKGQSLGWGEVMAKRLRESAGARWRERLSCAEWGAPGWAARGPRRGSKARAAREPGHAAQGPGERRVGGTVWKRV